MRWIQIKDLLINLDNIISVCVNQAQWGVWVKPCVVIQGLNSYYKEIEFQTAEEALDCLNQIKMFIKPVLISCHK